jgi:hypothetical protein
MTSWLGIPLRGAEAVFEGVSIVAILLRKMSTALSLIRIAFGVRSPLGTAEHQAPLAEREGYFASPIRSGIFYGIDSAELHLEQLNALLATGVCNEEAAIVVDDVRVVDVTSAEFEAGAEKACGQKRLPRRRMR